MNEIKPFAKYWITELGILLFANFILLIILYFTGECSVDYCLEPERKGFIGVTGIFSVAWLTYSLIYRANKNK